jgi:hypothetical protein
MTENVIHRVRNLDYLVEMRLMKRKARVKRVGDCTTYKVSTEKPAGKTTLKIIRRMWEDNFKRVGVYKLD